MEGLWQLHPATDVKAYTWSLYDSHIGLPSGQCVQNLAAPTISPRPSRTSRPSRSAAVKGGPDSMYISGHLQQEKSSVIQQMDAMMWCCVQA
jgi:hypothetical protein